MVRCYGEDLDRLSLPRGLLDDATRVVEAAGSRLEVDDRRPTAHVRELGFTGHLSAAQEDAVAALADHDLGVLVAPTGAGKTVMAAMVLTRRDLGTRRQRPARARCSAACTSAVSPP